LPISHIIVKNNKA